MHLTRLQNSRSVKLLYLYFSYFDMFMDNTQVCGDQGSCSTEGVHGKKSEKKFWNN